VALSSRAWKDPRFKSFTAPPKDTYEAFLSVPLISSEQVIGVINVHHKDPRNHSPEDGALVNYDAEQMSGAISRTRLSEKSRAPAKKVRIARRRRPHDHDRGLSRSNSATSPQH